MLVAGTLVISLMDCFAPEAAAKQPHSLSTAILSEALLSEGANPY